ncbi:hypothetical protein LJ655_29575, partial [Paraburkholderia sp. MMS20-SJTN17]
SSPRIAASAALALLWNRCSTSRGMPARLAVERLLDLRGIRTLADHLAYAWNMTYPRLPGFAAKMWVIARLAPRLHHGSPIVRIKSMCIDAIQCSGSEPLRESYRGVKPLLDERYCPFQGVHAASFIHRL